MLSCRFWMNCFLVLSYINILRHYLTLSTTDNCILLTHQLGAKNKSQPPLKESLRIARAEGKCSQHKGWWREGKDKLATHSMTTEVWISTRGRIPEATRIALQEALEVDG